MYEQEKAACPISESLSPADLNPIFRPTAAAIDAGKYNEVLPNGAERILAMAEQQSSHRQQLEKTVVESNCKSEKRGTYCGFTLCLIALLGGFWLLSVGKDGSGIAAVITSLASPLGVFIYGKFKQSQERQDKRQNF